MLSVIKHVLGDNRFQQDDSGVWHSPTATVQNS